MTPSPPSFAHLGLITDVGWGQFAIASAVGLAIAALLHLLRVRLRRVPVESLLFFQLAGMVRQPRVLWGSPRRLLALALCVALVGSLISAWAGLRSNATGSSRVVVWEGPFDAEADLHPELLSAASRLGPHGAVLTLDQGMVRTVLHSDESPHLLPKRVSQADAADLPTAASTRRKRLQTPLARVDALQAARARLLDSNGTMLDAAQEAPHEIVWLYPMGSPTPPTSWCGITVRSIAIAPPAGAPHESELHSASPSSTWR